jgi:hypothetical protein
MATKTDLANVLSRHIGRENGITANNLAGLLQALPRTVRSLISELRMDGIAVCGHPSAGYYIAATSEELEETCQFLRGRAMHSLAIESKLRKVPMEDLVGQLHLNT